MSSLILESVTTKRSLWSQPIFRHKAAMASSMILIFLACVAAVPAAFATHDPNDLVITAALQPPSSEHLAGTDRQGRDTWSRLIYGTRPTLTGSLAVVLISMLGGIPLGLVAGYLGGRVDELIMRCIDLMLAFPALLLAMLIVATFGPGLTNAVIALGIIYIPSLVRIVRGVTLVERRQAYVESARSLGNTPGRIMIRHILPNITSPILVHISLSLAYAILSIAALSYLGLGMQPPDPDWGSMLANGRTFLLISPYVSVFSGLAIVVAVIALNLFGDGLQAQLDPRQHEETHLLSSRG